MKNILQNGKLLATISAGTLFTCSIILVLYGVYVLGATIHHIVMHFEELDPAMVATKFIAIMDIHLLAIILYIFSVGLYELFVGELQVPVWLKIETIDELKAKLASVIILILAITFTKKVVEWKDPLDTLYFAIAISLICAVLIFYYKAKEK